MPEIVLKNIAKRFGKFVAVENLNLNIESNSFITLLGPSGCGKTTTLRMIAGLETPTEGKISIDFIMFISLTWKLPDFITDLLFELAHKRLSMRDPRDVLLQHILRVEWEDGVEKANAHMKLRKMKPITI